MNVIRPLARRGRTLTGGHIEGFVEHDDLEAVLRKSTAVTFTGLYPRLYALAVGTAATLAVLHATGAGPWEVKPGASSSRRRGHGFWTSVSPPWTARQSPEPPY